MTGMTPATEITGIRSRAGPRFRRRREHGVAAWVCGTSPRCRTVRQAILLPWAFRQRPLVQGRIAMRPDTGVPRTCMTWAGGARHAPPCSIPGPLKRSPSQSTGTRRAPERLQGIARGLSKLQISRGSQADLLRFSDDQMIVQGDPKRVAGALYLQRHGDVCLRRGGIAAGVVVDHPF